MSKEKQIIELLENDFIITTGEQLYVVGREGELVLLGTFAKKNEEGDNNVYLASAAGVLMLEANELYELAQEKAKKQFFDELDDLTKKSQAVKKLSNKKST